MGYTDKKKRVAWLTEPSFIDTDIHAIKKLCHIYELDLYLLNKYNNHIDYLDELNRLATDNKIHFSIVNIDLRNSDPRVCIKYKGILKSISRSKPDLVYSTMLGVPYFVPMMRMWLRSCPAIIAIHNVHVPKGAHRYLLQLIYTTLTIKFFNNFITFSKSQRDYLKVNYKKKNSYMVQFMLKNYGEASVHKTGDEIVFLNFGNIRDYKRIDTLILAAQDAYSECGVRFKVIIAGACDEWEKYAKLVKYPELFDLRIGRVDEKDIPNLFAVSDFFVAPYQDIAQSGSALVAFTYDTPIIASDLPAFNDYVINAETGYRMKPADKDSLKEIMVNILKSKNENYNCMVSNIKKLKKSKFSEEAVIQQYVDIFEKVMKAK